MRKYILPSLGLCLGLTLSLTLGACDGDDGGGGAGYDAVAACEDFVDAWNALDCQPDDGSFELDKASTCDPDAVGGETSCSDAEAKAASDCVFDSLGCFDPGTGTELPGLDPDANCPVCE